MAAANTQNLSPWTLPKLELPTEPSKPSKRGRYIQYNGLYPIQTGRKTIQGLSKASDARLKAIPNRDSINTIKTSQRDKTDMIKRGGR